MGHVAVVEGGAKVSHNAKNDAYVLAQTAVSHLKSAIHLVLSEADTEGLRNVDIGKSLGIYMGHVGHQGHIPRAILALMEEEGVVRQDQENDKWSLVDYPPDT